MISSRAETESIQPKGSAPSEIMYDHLDDLHARLAELDLELQEGDITEKGYHKRKALLLAAYGQAGTDNVYASSHVASNLDHAQAHYPFEKANEISDYDYDTQPIMSQDVASYDLLVAPDSNSAYSFPSPYDQVPVQSSYEFAKPDLQMPLEPREIVEVGFDPHNDNVSMNKFDNLASILRHRGRSIAKLNAIVSLDGKGKEVSAITWEKLASRAEKVSQVIRDKSGLYRGDRVALLYKDHETIDFIVALLGCFLAGVVAVPINSVTNFTDVNYILSYTQSHLALTTDTNLKSFHREFISQGLAWPRGVEWWKTNEFGSYHPPSKKAEPPALQVPDLAYIEYSKSPTGESRGVVISHKTVMHQMTCLSTMLASRTKNKAKSRASSGILNGMSRNQTVLSYLDSRQSIGMIVGVLLTVYSGNTLVSIPQSTLSIPGLYAHVISKHHPHIILADYPGLKQVAYNYQSLPLATRNYSKKHPVDLSSIEWCLIDCLTVDPEFHEILTDRWLRPLGNKIIRDVVAPMLTLSEHGGMVISMREWLGGQESLGCRLPSSDEEGSGSSDLSEVLLDKKALSTNNVRILSTTPLRGGFVDETTTDTVRIGGFGFPLPDATLAVVDPETSTLVPELVVGEIWVDSPCLSGGFWGQGRETELIFHARAWGQAGTLEMEFLRTGLLGFIYCGKVYILGLYEDRLRQRKEWEEQKNPSIIGSDIILTNRQYRYHYTAHLVQTIMQYVPKAFDSSAFDIYVNDEHLPVVLIESSLAITASETPNGPPQELDFEALEDMAKACMQKLQEIHNVRVYCVQIMAPNTLPRTIRNGRSVIGTMLCRKDFEAGNLPCVFIKFGIDRAVTNVTAANKNDSVGVSVGGVGGEEDGSIWSVAASNFRHEMLVHEDKQYSGFDERDAVMDDRTGSSLSSFKSIVDILQWRVMCQPEELSYCSIDSKSRESKGMTWKKLDAKIAAVAVMLKSKAHLQAGDVVILIYTHGEDFVHAVYACLSLGIIAVPLSPLDVNRLNEDVPALLNIIVDYSIKAILLSTDTDHAMKSKTISQHLKQSAQVAKITLPPTFNTMKPGKVSSGCKDLKIAIKPDWVANGRVALIWVYWTADQRRVAVKLGHDTILEMCKVQKETCQMSSSKPVIGCVRSSAGIGFLHTCFMGAYAGASTYLISPIDYAANPLLLLLSLARYKVKDTYATSQMLEHAMTAAPPKGYTLRETRNIMIAFDGRPKNDLFGKLRLHFASSGLDGTAINSIYSHVLNPMITTRSYMCIEPVEIKLDVRELRRGFIMPAAPDSGVINTLVVQDSGMVPVSTQVAVVNPETRRLCHLSEYGEIWVSSKASAYGFYHGSDIRSASATAKLDDDRFSARTLDGDQELEYMRTGDLGFLRTVTRPVGPGGTMVEIQVLFVLGAIGDTFDVMGLTHFPVDIEATIERSHRAITGCAVFQAGGLVVVVAETSSAVTLPRSASASASSASLASSSSGTTKAGGALSHAALVPVIVNSVLNEHQVVIDVVTFVSRGGAFPRSRLHEKQRGKIIALWVTNKLKTSAQFVVTNMNNDGTAAAAAAAAKRYQQQKKK
ncbi:hypothetical protein V1514DRAFT_333968 [Lipomyces japonicus]|uniref:uncharacterized protein n=1 Tax=Lipomyces japonicus TaxID=56871 RepID=UPI0034CDFEAE